MKFSILTSFILAGINAGKSCESDALAFIKPGVEYKITSAFDNKSVWDIPYGNFRGGQEIHHYPNGHGAKNQRFQIIPRGKCSYAFLIADHFLQFHFDDSDPKAPLKSRKGKLQLRKAVFIGKGESRRPIPRTGQYFDIKPIVGTDDEFEIIYDRSSSWDDEIRAWNFSVNVEETDSGLKIKDGPIFGQYSDSTSIDATGKSWAFKITPWDGE